MMKACFLVWTLTTTMAAAFAGPFGHPLIEESIDIGERTQVLLSLSASE